MRTRLASLTLIAALLGMMVMAQAPPRSSRFEGVIKSATSDQIVVAGKDSSGSPFEHTVKLAAESRLENAQSIALAAIKQGDYVGSGAKIGADGKLYAQEVRVFAEERRGSGEGHRPMGEPSMTMTNATVVSVATRATGGTMVLKYPAGEQSIDVPAGTPIFKMSTAERNALKPGVSVQVNAAPDEKGVLTAITLRINQAQ